MTDIELVGLPKFRKQLSYAEQQVFPKSARRAVNRTAKTTLTRTRRAIAKRMGVKQKDVKKRLELRKAPYGGNPQATIRITGRALNLKSFKARQVKAGVSAAPWGKRRIFPMAFIANVRGDNRLVMVRRKRGGQRVGRLPIRPVLGPGIAKTAADPELVKERRKTMEERMEIELRTALDFYVRRL